MTARSRRAALAAGDVGSLALFTVIGLENHEGGITLAAVLRVVGPIVAVGVAATLVCGTYRRPGVATLLPAWVVSVPGGILLRKALFHAPRTWASTGVFLAVALAFTLLFLLAWRLAARFILGVPLLARAPSPGERAPGPGRSAPSRRDGGTGARS